MDILSILGLLIGFGAILGGQYLEGGHIDSIMNAVALLIVLGGTLGAVMLQTPLNTFVRALKMLRWIFFPPKYSPEDTLKKVLEWNQIARKEGLFKLESAAEAEDNLFTQKGLQLIADGSTPDMVFEAMGGYSPTIGIIGAVLGLIHVMGNLADPSSLGAGIAVAFIATIYGVALANLLFLPIAGKLKTLILRRSSLQMMMIEGLIGVADGDNPRNIESRLQAYLG
jgi:chemotaxis protein MotA